MDNIDTVVSVHPYQMRILKSQTRFIAAIAGIQSGKTYSGCLWLRDRILEGISEIDEKKKVAEANGLDPDTIKYYDYLIAAPTYKILQQSTLKKWVDLVPRWLGTYLEQKSVFKLTKGGTVFVRSTEDPNSLEGMTLKAAWLDEAGQMKDAVWNIIYARLNILKGRCLITTSPYAFNWIYDDFIRQAEKGNPEFQVVNFESIDNPWFPKEEYEKAKETMDPYEFNRRYRGILQQQAGLVYEVWSPRYVLETLTKENHIKEYIAGVDFGYNHPMAIEVVGYSDDRPACTVVDEWVERGRTIDETILVLRLFQKKWNIKAVYADPSRPEYIQKMLENNIPVYKANNDLDKIDHVRSLMRTGNLFVLSSCKALLDEFRKYRYPEDGSKDEPMKVDDDACDALRYAVASYALVLPPPKGKVLSEEWQFIKDAEAFDRSKETSEYEEAIDSFSQDGLDDY